jgi:hypothetical protein
MLRAYFDRYRYGVARGADLLAMALAAGGAQAQAVHDQWITGVRR